MHPDEPPTVEADNGDQQEGRRTEELLGKWLGWLVGVVVIAVGPSLWICYVVPIARDMGSPSLGSPAETMFMRSVLALILLASVLIVSSDVRVPPDPWDGLLDDGFWDTAKPLYFCGNCGATFEEHRYFCNACNSTVGRYSNTMPWLHIFAIGDLLRYGVGPTFRGRKRDLAALWAIAISQYGPFGAIYMAKVHHRLWERSGQRETSDPEKEPPDTTAPSAPDA